MVVAEGSRRGRRVIGLHTVAEVRAAEDALLARTPEGALMQRAATGLATVCLRLLRQRLRTAGSCCSWAAATTAATRCYAGARLAGRGARVTAVLLDPDRAHAAGLAALRRAGGRDLPDADAARR